MFRAFTPSQYLEKRVGTNVIRLLIGILFSNLCSIIIRLSFFFF